MTVPVVYSACRCYPDVRFVLLTRPQAVERPRRTLGVDGGVRSNFDT